MCYTYLSDHSFEYRLGWNKAQDGHYIQECPYPPESVKGREWRAGYKRYYADIGQPFRPGEGDFMLSRQ